MGAFLEYPFGTALERYPMWKVSEREKFAAYVEAIQAVGPEHVIISSDLGQPMNPIHTDGITAFIQRLLAAGFTQEQIDWMSKRNPAVLLELEKKR